MVLRMCYTLASYRIPPLSHTRHAAGLRLRRGRLLLMPGGKYRSIQNPRMYRALRRRGYSKEQAARISNARTPGHRVKDAPRVRVTRDQLASWLDELRKRLKAREFSEANVTRDETGKFASHGGGGGASKPKPKPKSKPKPKPKPEPEPVSAEAITDTLTRTGLDPALVDALSEYFSGQLAEEPEDLSINRDAANALGAQGLVRVKPGDSPNAGIELTAAGKKLMKAVAAGDIAAAMSVVEAGHERAARVLERDRARDARNQEREQRRQERERIRQERAQQRAARQSQRGGSSRAAAPATEPQLVGEGGKSLRVFKDARGRHRWSAISSTAYRDRDGEIVSRQALINAVKAADVIGGDRGPLRYWHVPGLELGTCDYQAVSDDGRVLIEAGTFASPAIAARVARNARDWQLSIGFQHPANEPDADGVFRHVRIFERSLVPRGRAANPMTSLTIKEHGMLSDDKRQQLEALLGPELAGQMLAEVERTVKNADNAGVAYKDAPPEIVIGGVAYTRKAAPMDATPVDAAPVDAATAAMTDDAPDDMLEEPVGELSDNTDIVDLTVGDLKTIIAAAMEELIGSVSARLNEMRAQYDAMSKAFGQSQTEQAAKDDAAARAAAELTALAQSRDALAAQVAAIDARLKELEGEQPAAVAHRYRASEDPATVVAAAPTNSDPVASAYRMIFGEPAL